MKNIIKGIGRYYYECVGRDSEKDECWDSTKPMDWRIDRADELVRQGVLKRRGRAYTCYSCKKKKLEWDDNPTGLVRKEKTPKGEKLIFLGHICLQCWTEHDADLRKQRAIAHVPKPPVRDPETKRLGQSL